MLKDIRSVASCPFYLGDEGPQASYAWTTAPDGTMRRVKRAGEPGRLSQGVLAWAPRVGAKGGEGEGEVLYVLAGGVEGRWECFDLLPREEGGWALVRRGWRGFLGRQFVD